MGLDMLARDQIQLLWGYRPLVLFLAGWSFLVLTRAAWISRKRDYNWRRLGLSTLSGVLLAVGFPDIIPLPLLMFAGFVPLLIVEDEITREGGRGRKIFRHAYHAFVVWNVISTYWVANSALAAGIFAIWVNSLLLCIPFMLFHATRKVMPRLSYLALMVYWMSFEYIHLNWELTWPWLTLGNSFAEFPSWVQWYEYTGVFGGSLWILGVNALIFKAWKQYREQGKIPAGPALRISALVLFPIAFSLWIYYGYEEKGEEREIVVVQPNFEAHYEKFDIDETEQLNRFLELTAREVDENTDYVVYPETSFGYVETSQINEYPAIRRIRDFMRPYPDLKVATGLNAYRDFLPGEKHTRAVRERQGRDGQVIYFEVLNAAAQLSNRDEEVPVYRKSKLVPGPEIFPYREALFFLEPLVDKLEGTTAGVGTQPERSVFSSSSGKVGPAICYESVFGEYYTGYIRQGAQAIFIMTNDGWWDNTAGHRQHLYFASLRAIETRRSIARSANTGISAFINQRGDILQPLPYNVTGAIKGTIRFNDEITFYVLWGDMIARLSLFVAALLLLNTVVKRLKKD
jgi:apolipoprotein N-acyltransferase